MTILNLTWTVMSASGRVFALSLSRSRYNLWRIYVLRSYGSYSTIRADIFSASYSASNSLMINQSLVCRFRNILTALKAFLLLNDVAPLRLNDKHGIVFHSLLNSRVLAQVLSASVTLAKRTTTLQVIY